jgi:hypothetical protein
LDANLSSHQRIESEPILASAKRPAQNAQSKRDYGFGEVYLGGMVEGTPLQSLLAARPLGGEKIQKRRIHVCLDPRDFDSLPNVNIRASRFAGAQLKRRPSTESGISIGLIDGGKPNNDVS